MRRFSLLENCHRLAVPATSGSGTGNTADVHRCLHLVSHDSNLSFTLMHLIDTGEVSRYGQIIFVRGAVASKTGDTRIISNSSL
jgi:hypothetical protein